MKKSECRLCNRILPEKYITKHHLQPRVGEETVSLCQPCHKQLHVVLTNHELRHEYNTVEELKNHPEMQKFIKWIRKTDKIDIQVKESEKVRRWRG